MGRDTECGGQRGGLQFCRAVVLDVGVHDDDVQFLTVQFESFLHPRFDVSETVGEWGVGGGGDGF